MIRTVKEMIAAGQSLPEGYYLLEQSNLVLKVWDDEDRGYVGCPTNSACYYHWNKLGESRYGSDCALNLYVCSLAFSHFEAEQAAEAAKQLLQERYKKELSDRWNKWQPGLKIDW